jgi:hypothetical protein
MKPIIEVCTNIGDVLEGRRPVTIIESLKLGDRAYELAVDLAEYKELPHQCRLLKGENGRDLGEVVIIGLSWSDVARASAIIDKGPTFSAFPWPREKIALNLGLMLGYSAGECLDFLKSRAFDDCECDCCGGPSDAAKQRRIRRTMFHA